MHNCGLLIISNFSERSNSPSSVQALEAADKCPLWAKTLCHTEFGKRLLPLVEDVMERYYIETTNPKYLLFDDRTEEYLSDFNKLITAIRLPNGKVVAVNDYEFVSKYLFKDGEIYQKTSAGVEKNADTEKMSVIECPLSELYSSFEEYVEEELCGCCENGRYGEKYNPDGMLDWYHIGSRWPKMFLVKSSCTEYSYGERGSIEESEYPAPDGYRWVAAARKKNIEWDVMREWKNNEERSLFRDLENRYYHGDHNADLYKKKKDGIYLFGKLIYKAGESEESFLMRRGYSENVYPITVTGVFDEEMYIDYSEKELASRIDDAEEDDVFVGIDFHS